MSEFALRLSTRLPLSVKNNARMMCWRTSGPEFVRQLATQPFGSRFRSKNDPLDPSLIYDSKLSLAVPQHGRHLRTLHRPASYNNTLLSSPSRQPRVYRQTQVRLRHTVFPREGKAFSALQEKLRKSDNLPEGAELIFLLPSDR